MKSAGDKEKVFGELLHECTDGFGDPRFPRPGLGDLKAAGLLDEVDYVFRQLGGVSGAIPCKPGRYDFVLKDFVVEFDEEAHFNRYRRQTLSSELYRGLSGFSLEWYKNLCKEEENTCLEKRAGGGFWTNSSCETLFGKAAPNRTLTGNGSPRWKQRAFYDFLKDLTPKTGGPVVIRVSIYDTVKTVDGKTKTVEIVLVERDIQTFEILWEQMRAALR